MLGPAFAVVNAPSEKSVIPMDNGAQAIKADIGFLILRKE
jgi:hypothetical protein